MQTNESGEVFCCYSVVDIRNADILAYGEKYVRLNQSDFRGTERHGLRKVYKFVRLERIDGVLCYVFYYVNERKRNIPYLVFKEGKALGLK